MATIKVKDLTYYYPDTTKPALDKINLEVPPGQFVLLVGGSGSGKSTLLRAIAGLVPAFYKGICDGTLYLENQDMRKMDRRTQIQKVGMLFQDPEGQMIMNGVQQEIVFGMENLGVPNRLMHRRLMEVSSSLNLGNLLSAYIPSMSGGQKQKIGLASILAMQPEVLVLDEPTSQLDPIAAEEILTIVRRMNEENGITIIFVEQRLERCFHLADRIIVMESGKIIYDEPSPEKAAVWSVRNNSPFVPALPRLFASCGYKEVPTTVKKGRDLLSEITREYKETKLLQWRISPAVSPVNQENSLIKAENLWFSYPDGEEVLKNINLTIKPGDFMAVMGANGAGKTTLLKTLNGILRPSRGRVSVMGQDTRYVPVAKLAHSVAYLSQDPNDYLFLPTVYEELVFTRNNLGLPNDGYCENLLDKFHLEPLRDMNPRELSTGERQRVALASMLISKPDILLLDEPARGLDYKLKEELGSLLVELQKQGKAIIMVTHDIEFAAEYAQDIVMIHDGTVIDQGSKYEMLCGSTFYSPQIAKLFNNIAEQVLTMSDGQAVMHSFSTLCQDKKEISPISDAVSLHV